MSGAVEVLAAPPLLLVQDLGRPGWRASGVPAGGAMDRWAVQVANVLVGNAPGAAALEWAAGGGRLRFTHDTLVALAGADADATLGDAPLPSHTTALARAGAELRVGALRGGRFLYVAAAGGMAAAMVLGSRATYLPARFGGVEGRPLRAGDVVPIGHAARATAIGVACPADLRDPLPPPAGTVRVVRGPQAALLDDRTMRRLLETTFTIAHAGDRTGYRLAGPPIPLAADAALPSEPGVPGAVQLPPGGQPIVLMADAPTVGGYPKPLVVCTADLGRLAQLPPGSEIRFAEIDVAEAQRLYRRRVIAVDTLGRLGNREQ